jgi:hypothetical protein
LELVDCNGAEASIGDLFLRLTLALTVGDDLADGDLVFKTFDPDTQQFHRGPVVERLLVGTGVTLTASRESAGGFQGDVTVSLASFTGREIAPELVRIDDMSERFDGSIVYLAFLPDELTGLRARFNLPPSDLGTTPAVKLRAQLVGTAAGDPPPIVLTALVIPRPTGTPAIPVGDTEYTFDVTAAGTIAAGDYFEIESEAINVAAGDTVFLSLSRAGTDGYDGELGLLRMGLILQ